VLDDVLQRLLSDPVQRDLHVLGQPSVVSVDSHRQLPDRPGQAGERVTEPQVLEHRRTQTGQRRVRLGERQVGQLPRPREPGRDRISASQTAAPQTAVARTAVARTAVARTAVAGTLAARPTTASRRRCGRVQVIRQADQPLRDPVVNLPGQPPPLRLLRRDHLFREPLRGLLLGGQPPVQPGLVHRPRYQRPDRGKQPHIPVGEVATFPGVHVQHADQPGQPALHRHRHHRRVLPPAELGKVPVPGIGFFARSKNGRRAVAGHPAGHPLAHREPDLAHLPVVRRRRPGQRQRPAPVVEHVHEAHVGSGRGDDEPGHLPGQRAE